MVWVKTLKLVLVVMALALVSVLASGCYGGHVAVKEMEGEFKAYLDKDKKKDSVRTMKYAGSDIYSIDVINSTDPMDTVTVFEFHKNELSGHQIIATYLNGDSYKDLVLVVDVESEASIPRGAYFPEHFEAWGIINDGNGNFGSPKLYGESKNYEVLENKAKKATPKRPYSK